MNVARRQFVICATLLFAATVFGPHCAVPPDCESEGCGRVGAILYFFGGRTRVVEVSASGQPVGFVNDLFPLDGTVGTRIAGMTFWQRDDDLRLLLATEIGVRIYNGRNDQVRLNTFDTPECVGISDVQVAFASTAILSCHDGGNLLEINLESGATIRTLSCDDQLSPRFSPTWLARSGDDRLLSESDGIIGFDLGSGACLGVVIPLGADGTAQYEDGIFADSESFLIAANPGGKLLEFDAQTYQLRRVVTTESVSGLLTLSALAVDDEGGVFLGGDSMIVQIDRNTGEVVRRIVTLPQPGVRIAGIAIRP